MQTFECGVQAFDRSLFTNYPFFPLVKLLDIIVKPGTTVTPKGTTAILQIPLTTTCKVGACKDNPPKRVSIVIRGK